MVAFGTPDSDWRSLAGLCVLGGLFANGCYLAGPIAESSLRWLRFWHAALFYVFFVGGTLATALVASATLLVILLG